MVSIYVLLIVFLITFPVAAAGGQARRRVAEADEPVRLLSTEMEKL